MVCPIRVRYASAFVISVARSCNIPVSLLQPSRATRRLWLQRKGAPDIRYDESFLGVPVEVAVALLEARKRDVAATKAIAASGTDAAEPPLLQR